MSADVVPPVERFVGCLLGLAVGDALGGLFEAQSGESIRTRFATVADLIAYPQDELWYTDDTQMTIGVAEALVAQGEIVTDGLCQAFAAHYEPGRGYGRGARAVIEAMAEGRDHAAVAEAFFPGGSFGNGAAMRVAPVGLLCGGDPVRLLDQARQSARPTHRHPLGIEGAELIALAVGLASRMERFDPDAYFGPLRAACRSADYRAKVEAAARATTVADLEPLGNGIAAVESVSTALAAFALAPESFTGTIGPLIRLGGDTDTLAAMAGAISGAYLGVDRLPARLVGLLEDGPQGRMFLVDLAARLHVRAVADGSGSR